MLEIPLFLVGLVLLVKASDYLVKSAATIAKLLGVSELLIGLTLVAFGTSIPEMATAVLASSIRQNEIVSGNVIGACIMNMGVVLGLSAMSRRIRTNEAMLRRDGYVMILAMVLFLVFAYDLTVQRWEALVLVIFYFAYVMFLFGTEQKSDGRKYHFKEFIIYFFKLGYVGTIRDAMANQKSPKKASSKVQARKRRVTRELSILILSGIGVVLGAHLFIDGALYFANLLGVSGTFIGITLVSVGTTLPELTVSVTAAKKGFGNIAVGNVIGSNIANILLIAGVAGLIFPLAIINLTVWYTAPFMILIGLVVLAFIRTRWAIKRWEGAALFLLYLGFMAFLFLNPQ